MVTLAPERMSSRQAWTIAMRVRFFWLTRPVSLSVIIGTHPQSPSSRRSRHLMLAFTLYDSRLA
jgi:hypothetical protein